MTGYKGPIEFPILGQSISTAVKLFAEKFGCEYENWYHDEPVWFVRRRLDNSFHQQVQIAAFLTDEGEYLYFTPLAYLGSPQGGGIKITPCDTVKIFRLSLEELYPMSPKQRVDSICGQINLAWESAKSFNPKQAVA